MGEAATTGLEGRRVLVIEDEYFIVDDISRALTKLGAEVVGPAPDLEHATAFLSSGERIDSAVLDINLHGELVYPSPMRCGRAASPSCSPPATIKPPFRPATRTCRAGRSRSTITRLRACFPH